MNQRFCATAFGFSVGESGIPLLSWTQEVGLTEKATCRYVKGRNVSETISPTEIVKYAECSMWPESFQERPNGRGDHELRESDFESRSISTLFESGSGHGVTPFIVDRKRLFHFVCHKAGSGLWQYHTPHFRIADAISAASERTEEALQYPFVDGLSLLARSRQSKQ